MSGATPITTTSDPSTIFPLASTANATSNTKPEPTLCFLTPAWLRPSEVLVGQKKSWVVDQGEVFVPSGILNFIDADSVDLVECSVVLDAK
jgi:hypothetical protein